MYFVRPGVGRSRLGRLPCQNYGRWLCTAVGNTFGDAGRESFGGLRATDGGLSFDGLNAGVVGSEAVRGRGNLACAAMATRVVFVGEQRPDGGSSLDGLGHLQTIKVACVWLAGGNRWDFGGPSLRTCSQAEPGPSSGNKKESNLWREEVRSQHCQPPHCNWLLPG